MDRNLDFRSLGLHHNETGVLELKKFLADDAAELPAMQVGAQRALDVWRKRDVGVWRKREECVREMERETWRGVCVCGMERERDMEGERHAWNRERETWRERARFREIQRHVEWRTERE
eukprot:2516106-Rhodomonas_salina.1